MLSVFLCTLREGLCFHDGGDSLCKLRPLLRTQRHILLLAWNHQVNTSSSCALEESELWHRTDEQAQARQRRLNAASRCQQADGHGP